MKFSTIPTLLILLSFFLVTPLQAQVTPGDPGNFITTWKTDNSGTSNNDQITIPTDGTSTYNYDVYWEDVTDATDNGALDGNTGDLTITFPDGAGTYRVEISGDFPHIFFSNGGDAEKILTIEQWGDIAWNSMVNAFYGASNLEINASDAPDLSGVGSLHQMFRGASSLNSDLNNWDVSAITTMRNMFWGAGSFNGDISNWDVSGVDSFRFMFASTSSFNGDITGWDVSGASIMRGMFSGASAFNQDIDGWNVSNVTDMHRMFANASAFNQDLNSWDVSNVTDMEAMFNGAGSFNGDISSWNVSGVTNMRYMFFQASAFNQDISGWDVSSVTQMDLMFAYAGTFGQDLSGWDVSSVTDMTQMFYVASSFNANLGGWNVSNVAAMDLMLGDTNLSVANYDATLTGWAVQTVQTGVALGADGLEYCNAQADRQSLIDDDGWTITGDALAAGCSSDPFITTWKTDNPGDSNNDQITIPTNPNVGGYNYNVEWGDGNSDMNVTGDITHTYTSAGTYTVEITGDFPGIYFNNSGDKDKILTIEQWGDIEWTTMNAAFYGASNLEINAMDAPDLSGVSTMLFTFANATSLNSDLNNWDVSTITSMVSMFDGAESFNGDISNWDVSNVTSMNAMFQFARSFNQDISGWDVSNVTDMNTMFQNGIVDPVAFNQDLSSWDISNVSSMSNMLNNTSLSVANYDATLTGWAGQTVQSGVTLGANGLEYCNAQADRQSLIDDDNWIITGDALAAGCSSGPFITTWKTDNPGVSNDDQITIPTDGASTYNYDVYWEDVTDASINGNETGATGDLTITFPAAGTYRVEITGDFPHIFFSNGGDAEKILTIEQWGDIAWSSMFAAFHGAANLEINATDAPDLSAVTSLENMFRDASSLNSDLNNWDVSAVTDMENMFNGAGAFNGDISSWNVSNVINMEDMFWAANSFNGDITGWDVSGAANMRFMFAGAGSFNRDISGWNVSNVTTMHGMFSSAGSFDQDLGGWNISSVTEMGSMFSNSGLSVANYDATLIGWAAQSVQSGVDLGASSLEYCNAQAERQSLIDDDGWSIIGDALASGCSSSAADNEILASNLNGYTFAGSDFGQSDPAVSVKIKALPAEEDLMLNGSPVALNDEISVADIDNGDLTYTPGSGDHGYEYDSFEFSIVDAGGNESSDTWTLTIHAAAATLELTGDTGWRFLTSPALGAITDTYTDFLSPISVKGIPGSSDPGATPTLYELDQANYQWETVSNMSDHTPYGDGFIVWIDGSELPATLTTQEIWPGLDFEYSYSGLGYDTNQGPYGNSHHLIANPHPISLDFCQFNRNNVSFFVDFWDPGANGGNGDYVNLSCGTGDIFIAPFQSFWIRTTDPNPSLSIPEAAYMQNMEAGYFKQPSKGLAGERSAKSGEDFTDLGDAFLLSLEMQSTDGVFTNTTRILFSKEANEGLDAFDAPKLSPAGLANKWLSFYSLDEKNKAYAFQSFPKEVLSKQEKIRIPLDVQTTEAGTYSLTWNIPDQQMFAGSYFLRDNQTGEVIELTDGSEYHFEIEAAITLQGFKNLGGLIGGQRSAKSFGDFADLGEADPRFELLVAAEGVDGYTELGTVPEEFTLDQNYPNPFNPTTVIRYQLPVNSHVRLEVYDMIGRRIATLVEGQVAAGRHTVNFDASRLSSGIYLYRLQAGTQIMTKKLTVVK